MKKILVVWVLFCAFFKMFADDDDKLKLAVMDFEDLSGKISEETLAGASEYIRVAFASTNRYVIISKERQKNTVSDMRKKFNTDPRYKSCTDKNCQIQLGQALSADLIVKTTVSFFADSYTLSSELIDLEKEATIIAAREEYDGSQKTMKTAMDKIVAKIVEAEKSQTSSSVQNQSINTTSTVKPNQSAKEYDPLKDKELCKNSIHRNNIAGWEEYLAVYPEGKCAKMAKTNIKNKKNKPRNWSNLSPLAGNYTYAVNYCKNLEEDGHKDWRLPNISELREMVQDCPKIEPGGECKIRKDNTSTKKWKWEQCACAFNEDEYGAFSKLGDSMCLWSSTVAALSFSKIAYKFCPLDGSISPHKKTQLNGVRCIRDEKK